IQAIFSSPKPTPNRKLIAASGNGIPNTVTATSAAVAAPAIAHQCGRQRSPASAPNSTTIGSTATSVESIQLWSGSYIWVQAMDHSCLPTSLIRRLWCRRGARSSSAAGPSRERLSHDYEAAHLLPAGEPKPREERCGPSAGSGRLPGHLVLASPQLAAREDANASTLGVEDLQCDRGASRKCERKPGGPVSRIRDDGRQLRRDSRHRDECHCSDSSESVPG